METLDSDCVNFKKFRKVALSSGTFLPLFLSMESFFFFKFLKITYSLYILPTDPLLVTPSHKHSPHLPSPPPLSRVSPQSGNNHGHIFTKKFHTYVFIFHVQDLNSYFILVA